MQRQIQLVLQIFNQHLDVFEKQFTESSTGHGKGHGFAYDQSKLCKQIFFNSNVKKFDKCKQLFSPDSVNNVLSLPTITSLCHNGFKDSVVIKLTKLIQQGVSK